MCDDLGLRKSAAISDKETGLVKGLGLLDATTLVVGSMIGSGIFIVSADIARQVQSPGLLMMDWFLTAALTLTAALCYGELAAAMPRAGSPFTPDAASDATAAARGR